MKTCHCEASANLNNGKCDNVHHIEALNGRAAAFEAMGDLDRATHDAERILVLAPELPDGYLRLGNIAQLQKNGDFAWEIYTMGIEAVKETTTDLSPKLQSMLTLLLDKSPCLEYLKIKYLQDEIVFHTNGKTWNRLRYFSFGAGCLGPLLQFRVDEPGGFPCSFLQDAASSLQHLDFVGIPVEWYDSEPFIPFLPKLKTLRINGTVSEWSEEELKLLFPIYPLSVAFPRLEQLCIGPEIPYFDPEPVSMWRDKREDIWPHLKVLIFEVHNFEEPSFETARTRSALRCLTCINRGNSLQHIALDFHQGWPDMDIFSGSDDLLPDFDIVQDSEFKNLRSFKSTSLSISPEGARNLLSKAIQTNQLTSFDIVFPTYYDDSPLEARHVDHLRGYDWARGAPSIQSLGCYGLRLHPPPNNDQDHLVCFLATFPNLRTLSIECKWDDIADYVSLLGKILRQTHLETMYMQLVDNEACVPLERAARDRGVRLMELSDRFVRQYAYSREWPVSLGE
ncbi:uncharacterized protein CPUR_03013 [Claviceps purpurea 20.1]|uniref:Uncharacterized protein n=1 Tax=Claviceps purpurea (strain 20.1) TaxID=1111077 RepID=M1W4I4_CLAP2|nr:uncharacterized protein CPUR_03013 [Claviceps purpurea 20.1]